MSAALEFQNVSVAISSGRLLLDDVSLALEEGTVTAILGRSGSGKTTLMRTANRMIEPSGGQVLVAGTSVHDLSLILLRRQMGYVIQETGLFPHLDVERNVGIVLEAQRKVARKNASLVATSCCKWLASMLQSFLIAFRINSPAGSGSA